MKMCNFIDKDSAKITVQEHHKKFKVTITEKLQKIIAVEAMNRAEAERIISDNWENSEYILDAENFVDVSFVAVLAGDHND